MKERFRETPPAVALIGCGQWGKNLARNLTSLGALKTICDTNPVVLEGVRRLYPSVRVASQFSEVLADPTIQGCVIATPPSSHYNLSHQALMAGKDVFAEKPLALEVRQGQELVACADEKKRVLMVGHLLEYHPAVNRLKGLVDDGELGRLQYLYSNRLNLGKFRVEENILWSFAPHDIAVIIMLLGEMPDRVAARGGSYLSRGVADVTVTNLTFPSGVKAHIFVSWLHPYKEQRLVVVGDRGMAEFNDISNDRKLVLYRHRIDWINRSPVATSDEGESVPIEDVEPLWVECKHFLERIRDRRQPRTNGRSALRILKVLDACQRSLNSNGGEMTLEGLHDRPYFAHETAVIDEPCEIGRGTKIWHFSHIMRHSCIGEGCTIGQNVMVGPDVTVGNRVKIQNNVSVYTGVTIEDDVFLGPSMVFTNVINPRSHVSRKDEFRATLVRQGATIGANATVLCGLTIGRYAFVGAGAVVTRNIPDYALVVGIPARVSGWMCQCGIRIAFEGTLARCTACGTEYRKDGDRVLLVVKGGA